MRLETIDCERLKLRQLVNDLPMPLRRSGTLFHRFAIIIFY